MARYYFHIDYPGSPLIRDDEGQEFDDLPSAEREAIASANDLARQATKRGDSVKGMLIQIADEAGIVLASIHAPEKLH